MLVQARVSVSEEAACYSNVSRVLFYVGHVILGRRLCEHFHVTGDSRRWNRKARLRRPEEERGFDSAVTEASW